MRRKKREKEREKKRAPDLMLPESHHCWFRVDKLLSSFVKPLHMYTPTIYIHVQGSIALSLISVPFPLLTPASLNPFLLQKWSVCLGPILKDTLSFLYNSTNLIQGKLQLSWGEAQQIETTRFSPLAVLQQVMTHTGKHIGDLSRTSEKSLRLSPTSISRLAQTTAAASDW